MYQTVELAELAADRLGQSVILDRRRSGKIEDRDGGPGCAGFLDFIVETIEFGGVASRYDHARAGASAFQGERSAQARRSLR